MYVFAKSCIPVLGKHQGMNDHARSEQMHPSLRLLRKIKKRTTGMKRAGMFRTKAPVIAVTAQQKKRKLPGMNRSGRPEQAQSFATEKSKTPRDKPFRDVPKQIHQLLWLRCNSKKENFKGWILQGCFVLMRQLLRLRRDSKKRTRPGMNRSWTSRIMGQLFGVTAQQQKENTPEGWTVEGHPEQMHKSCCGKTAKREPTQGWTVEGHPGQMQKSLWLRHSGKK